MKSPIRTLFSALLLGAMISSPVVLTSQPSAVAKSETSYNSTKSETSYDSKAAKAAAPKKNLPPPAASKKDVKPIAVGETAPNATVKTPDGKPVELSTYYKKGPSLVIFYRGGWCAYCNIHLAQLSTIEPILKENNIQILALSPDKPQDLRPFAEKKDIGYTLLSDSDAEAMSLYHLAYVDSAYGKEKLGGYSGKDHGLLPVPAAYLIGADGKIKYAYHNIDVKVRADVKDILAAASELVGKELKLPEEKPKQ